MGNVMGAGEDRAMFFGKFNENIFLLNNVRICLIAEHVYFLFYKYVISRKNFNYPKSCRVPFIPLCFRFQFFTQSSRALSLHKSAALTFG